MEIEEIKVTREEPAADTAADDNGELLDRLQTANEQLEAANERAASLEAQIICMRAGVREESIDDVITLAAALSPDGCTEDGIAQIIGRYPFFAAKAARTAQGIHFAPSESTRSSGIEAAFRRSNPNVRI